MKITCPADSLLAALQSVQGAAAPRTTKPILACVKLIAHDDTLTLMATDTEIGIRHKIAGVSVLTAGECVVSAERVIRIIRESEAAEIHLSATDTDVTIRAGGRYTLPAYDPREFPDIPQTEIDCHFSLPAVELAKSLRRVSFAAEHKEGARWAVTGVQFEVIGDRLNTVATDTKQLAMATTSITVVSEPGRPFALVPIKTINLLLKVIEGSGSEVQVWLTPNAALFTVAGTLIHTRLVQGKFPPYQQIIPKKLAHKLVLPTTEFFSRVRQAAITTEADSRRVEFKFGDSLLTLQARGADAGSSEVEMPIPSDQIETDIAMDPGYFAKAAKAFDGEKEFTLEIENCSKPVLLRLPDQNYTYLLMPLGERGS